MITAGDPSQIAQRYRALIMSKQQRRTSPEDRDELKETLLYASSLCEGLGTGRYAREGTLDLSMPISGILSIEGQQFHATSALASIPYTPFYDDRSLRLITSTVTGRHRRERNGLERGAVQLTEEGRIDAYYDNTNGRFHIANWHAPEYAQMLGINPYRTSVEAIIDDLYVGIGESDDGTEELVSSRFLYTPFLVLAHMRLVSR